MLGCNVVPPEVQMKAKSPRVGLQCLLAVCALAACSSHKGAINASSGERSESIHQARREGEKVTELDLNHDGKPDVWLYTVTAKTADGREYQRLVRKEMDINWDGKSTWCATTTRTSRSPRRSSISTSTARSISGTIMKKECWCARSAT